MKRIPFALPLAGAMMTASFAFAQTTPAVDPTQPPRPAPTAQDGVQPERGDCVDVSGGVPPQGTAEELRDALGDNPPADAETEAQARADGADPDLPAGEQADSSSETPPVAGADAGTAPGGSGSSGWTGGLGGSDIGTSQSEELETSPQQEHPQVASGLDPISGETAVTGPQAPPEIDDDAQVAPTAPDDEQRASAGC